MQTEIIPVDPRRPDLRAIAHVAELLERGAVIAFPTETVYGLGCLAERWDASARIFVLKNRRPDKPLAFYLPTVRDLLRRPVRISPEGRRLIDRFLPGPLTVVFEAKVDPKMARDFKVAFRISSNEVVTRLLEVVGKPLVGTSANLSGSPSPTTAGEVLEAFRGRIEVVLDAGPTELGTDSTVIDCSASPPVIVREGAISAAEIASALGVPVDNVLKRPGSPSS